MISKEKEVITSDDILGKDVVDIDGDRIGIVQQLKIDKKTKRILGILVDQGFMKADLFIGLDLISNFGIDSVFLNQSPHPKLKGMEVFDKHGKSVGIVSDVEEYPDNKLIAIIVKKHSLGKSYTIKAKYIKRIGVNIILRYAVPDIKFEE